MINKFSIQPAFLSSTAKIFRIFRLIALLKGKARYTAQQLANYAEDSERTIYRDIGNLELMGFCIEEDFNNSYFIICENFSVEEYPGFSLEEARLLREMISRDPAISYMKEDLIRKIYMHSEQEVMAQNMLDIKHAQICRQLSKAIRNQNRVELVNYHSANSETIASRIVEPISFSENFKTLLAFDAEAIKNKHFKIERIQQLKILEEPYQFKGQHSLMDIDIFGMSGENEIEISLKLTLRAYSLLREEHNQAIPYLFVDDGAYYFRGPVKSFEGIGRFVLGLPDEIEISAPPEFSQYVINKIKLFTIDRFCQNA